MAVNASELMHEMFSRIQDYHWTREVTDPTSPAQVPLLEAKPGCSFELRYPLHNIVDCRSLDLRWATAYALHFFAATEKGACFRRYNKMAEKFLTGDDWIGAYGSIAMPQIGKCIEHLREHPYTRRAIVSMGGFCDTPDMNRPACWSFLQFLCTKGALDMCLFQRSLQLFTVGPYDLIVLTNILKYVAEAVGLPLGALHWTVGSLHCRPGERPERVGQRNMSLIFANELLESPKECWNLLSDPDSNQQWQPWASWLSGNAEVRT
jgi:hypothetical protein